MWALAGAMFGGCKWLTWRQVPAGRAAWWRHAAYLLAWPGMDAEAFLGPQRGTVTRPPAVEWGAAILNLLVGASLFWGVAGWVREEHAIARGWVGMAGLVLMIHFGAFHLLSCAWRAAGVDARPLMNGPLRSHGVSEFWGQRWNTAFRDLTHQFLFRPLTRRFGPRAALGVGFLVSGVVHDLVISVPAGGGYGGPTAYFVVQAIGMCVERSRWAKALGLGRGRMGWSYAMLVVAVPSFALFHPLFVRNVVLPFLAAAGVGGGS
jgi:hypothetical protein